MVDKKQLESDIYRLKDQTSLKKLFVNLNYDIVDEPVNKENWNEFQKGKIDDVRIIAKIGDFRIFHLVNLDGTLRELKEICTKIISKYDGRGLICTQILKNENNWMFSALSKDFSKNFKETRHFQFEIRPNQGVLNSILEFFNRIEVDGKDNPIEILVKISKSFDNFSVEIHNELTVNVFDALKILSEGIINNEENKLVLNNESLEKVREPIFILLYRIIFILYAEDRAIFPINDSVYYNEFSIKWIKQKWLLENEDKIKEGNVQDRLRKIFHLIELGSEGLGIDKEKFFMRAYYGRLFDRKTQYNLEKWKIPNTVLLKSLQKLTQTKDKKGNKFFLDYSVLDTRHLGSIYEHLLEFHLHVENGKIAELPNPEDRKISGSYYTPENIVENIIQDTIEPAIQEIVNKIKNKEEIIEKILTLKIVDPAMGSGHFLVAVVEYLAKRICEIQSDEVLETEFIERKRDVVRRCIYGVDKNILAVDLARLALWLETLSSEKPLSFLSAHLKHGNSLMNADFEEIFDPQQTLTESIPHTHLKKVVRDFLGFESLEDDTASAVRAKLEKYQKMHGTNSFYFKFRGFLDNLVAGKLGVEIPSVGDLRQKIGEESLDFYSSDSGKSVNELRNEHVFFHWELEFPEIFFDSNGNKKKNPGFDIIVGNPPYVEVKKIEDSLKPYIRKTFQYNGKEIMKGRFDIFWGFMKQGIDLLKDGGYLGFLTEDSILDAVGADTLRTFMLKENKMIGFRYTGKFPGAGVHTVISILRKEKDEDYEFTLENWVEKVNIKLKKSFILNQHKQVINLNWTYQKDEDLENNETILKIEENSEDLEKIIFLQQGVIVQWGTGESLTRVKEDCIFSTKKDKFVPYLEGKNVSRYKFPKKHDWLDYRPDKHWRPRMREVFENPKLLVRRIATESLVCLLDYGYYFVDNTLFTGNRWIDLLPLKTKYSRQLVRMEKALKTPLETLAKISKQFEYEYLLGVLNSRIMTYYYERKFQTKSLEVLTKCKIKKTDEKNRKVIGLISKTLQELQTNDKNTEFLDTQVLDSLIYEVYLEELLDSNLINLVEPYSIEIEKAFEKNEKSSLEEIINSIEQNSEIIKEIEKIKQSEIIKKIEED